MAACQAYQDFQAIVSYQIYIPQHPTPFATATKPSMEEHDKKRATMQAGDETGPAAKRTKTSENDDEKKASHGVAPIKAEFAHPHLQLRSLPTHSHLLTRQLPLLAHHQGSSSNESPLAPRRRSTMMLLKRPTIATTAVVGGRGGQRSAAARTRPASSTGPPTRSSCANRSAASPANPSLPPPSASTPPSPPPALPRARASAAAAAAAAGRAEHASAAIKRDRRTVGERVVTRPRRAVRAGAGEPLLPKKVKQRTRSRPPGAPSCTTCEST